MVARRFFENFGKSHSTTVLQGRIRRRRVRGRELFFPRHHEASAAVADRGFLRATVADHFKPTSGLD
jgi:hypothetical protein